MDIKEFAYKKEKQLKIYNISVLVSAFDETEALKKLENGYFENPDIISVTNTD